MINEHSHLIEINYEERKLIIYRIFPDGKKQLYTNVNLPALSVNDTEEFSLFAQTLGENILFDSPVARKIFKL